MSTRRRRRKPEVDPRVQHEIDVQDGEYYYVNLPPGNGEEFPVIQERLLMLGVEAEFSKEPSRGRGYRIKRTSAHLLPRRAVEACNTIPCGCPSGSKYGGSMPLYYCDSLAVLHSEWIPITSSPRDTERGEAPDDTPKPLPAKRRRKRKGQRGR